MADLPKFNGQVGGRRPCPLSCGQFLTKVEVACQRLNWSEPEKVSHALGALEGLAKSWADEFKADCDRLGLPVRWTDFKSEMMTRFPAKLSIREKVDIRKGLKQKSNEAVEDFMRRCERAQFLICDDVENAFFEREILLNFLLGLKKSVQDEAIKSDALTLEGFLSEAVRIESGHKPVALDYLGKDPALDDAGQGDDGPEMMDFDEFEDDIRPTVFVDNPNLPSEILGLKSDNKIEVEVKDPTKAEAGDCAAEDDCEDNEDWENNVELTCSECGCGFPSEKALERHSANEHNATSSKVRCKLCPAVFKSRAKYLDHMRARHEDSCFSCSSCNSVFFDRVALLAHQAIKHEARADGCVVCPLCHQPKKRMYSLKYHIRRVHMQERPFPCKVCPKSFYDPHSLDSHIRSIHLMEKPHECDVCHKRYGSMSGLHTHKREFHPKGDKLQCSECTQTFGSQLYLKEHMVTAHLKERPCICEECGATFRRKNNLRQHKKAVHGAFGGKSFECPYEGCAVKFCNQAKLKIHTDMVHEKKKGKESCTMCDRKFWSKLELRVHVDAIHLGRKPHKCPHCDFETAYKGHVREHIRASHNSAKFSCPYPMCNHQANYKGNLDKHIRNIHTKGLPANNAATLPQKAPDNNGVAIMN